MTAWKVSVPKINQNLLFCKISSQRKTCFDTWIFGQILVELNTKSENNVNRYVGGLITMHWQWTYTWMPSEVSIYKGTHNENVTLYKVDNTGEMKCIMSVRKNDDGVWNSCFGKYQWVVYYRLLILNYRHLNTKTENIHEKDKVNTIKDRIFSIVKRNTRSNTI